MGNSQVVARGSELVKGESTKRQQGGIHGMILFCIVTVMVDSFNHLLKLRTKHFKE